MDSRSRGCAVEGPHLHVVRRQNVNGAWSKSRKSWVMPVDFLVVRAADQYALEHHEVLGEAGGDFLLVNLFRPPYGSPVTCDAIGELCESLSRRAGLGRRVCPRMCRHAMASNVVDAGGSLDEVQALLGQKHPSSPRPYLHADPSRLRAGFPLRSSWRLPGARPGRSGSARAGFRSVSGRAGRTSAFVLVTPVPAAEGLPAAFAGFPRAPRRAAIAGPGALPGRGLRPAEGEPGRLPPCPRRPAPSPPAEAAHVLEDALGQRLVVLGNRTHPALAQGERQGMGPGRSPQAPREER
ncbi:tyrosine-type recombinase/integrase [Streptomyces sp. NPDC059455]|uniref:tyrosine-type recombinase/integrase n=1 Tax=Streptomyces sp. NPDC059455 TaxID=3346837 RepID=UPI0036C8D06F